MKRVVSRHPQGLRTLAQADGAVVMLSCVAVLAFGWGFNIVELRSPLPGFPTMKPNTAVGLIGLGASLFLGQLRIPRRRRLLHLAGAAAALVSVAIAVVTLAEYWLGWNSALDEWLFRDPQAAPMAFPGRPAPVTAWSLLLLGLSQLRFRARRWRYIATLCALTALFLVWSVFNGYLLARSNPVVLARFGSVAPHTAGALFLVAIGTLASRPRSWPASTVLAQGVGGVVCRWLLPAAVLAPPALGWLLSDVAMARLHEAAVGWALYSVFSSAGSVGLILVLARRIELLDSERAAATALSRRDPLTGLANRRAFDEFLLHAFARAQRYGRKLSLLTIDVDDFKRYNDAYGHPAGDEVLKAIARTFIDAARDTDLVARTGGEEFAIVLPETEAPGARALAERVREEIASLRRLRRPITVSIGVAVVSERTATVGMLVKEADAALYAAKRAGRNCVVSEQSVLSGSTHSLSSDDPREPFRAR